MPRPVPPSPRRLLRALLPLLVVALALPASASAHAQLEGSVPVGGTVVAQPPATVEFRFSEPVQSTDDAVQVLAPDGDRVGAGAPFHPDGDRKRLAVRLAGDLPQGSYTATYRVTSADGHPIANGIVFSIGRASATGTSVADALKGAESGPVTRTAFAVVRALQYLAIALGVGALLVVLLVLRPVGLGGGGRRGRQVVVAGAVVGALSAAAGTILQGAEIAGTSFWGALSPGTIGDALGTRFGLVWAIAAGAWVLVGVLSGRVPALRGPVVDPPAVADEAAFATSASGVAAAAVPASAVVRAPADFVVDARAGGPGGRPAAVVVALAGAWILLLPSLAGHAATISPRGVLFASLLLHVVAMAVWVGGLVLLAAAVPATLRDLPSAARADRLASAAERFSRIAIWAVLAVAVSGAVQGYVLVREPSALLDTAHGRAVLIKTLLICAIAALATRNHRRTVPALRAAAPRQASVPAADAPALADAPAAATGGTTTAGGRDVAAGDDDPAAPVVAGRLRRLVRAELALLLAVFAATGALSTEQPAVAIPPGPVTVERDLGPLRARVEIAPARVGTNRVRITLRDAAGRPFPDARSVDLAERPPERGAAALQQTASPTGAPGELAVDALPFPSPGRWSVVLTVRVSEFDQYDARFDLEVRR
ncbi:copper resistance protein CopC [Patulibacter brassicae]|uniref:Copper resistance protein CopC n=1 Tax=Patulibacter brassicae TaxID=1705717 RepID=A0ABU4VP74_9ACTN|nr:copper resistance protein CopC [Patulibacter brassicae]MDX8153638.1 copper resistance protein CopC [Patulibacter brassicae]